MKKLEIFNTLRRHRALAEKRSITYTQNKVAKWIIGFFSLFIITYLILIAIMFSLIANESRSTTALELMISLMPFFLTFDFWIRWLAQQTPSQIIKPYVLLPLPRYTCIDTFIFRSLFNWNNTIWLAMLLPFCLMSVLFAYGFGACVSLLLIYYLMTLANSQWYSIVRTLVLNRQLWWLLPIGFYAAVFSPFFIGDDSDFDQFFDLYAIPGTMLDKGNILPILIAFAILALLVTINRRLQFANVMRELGRAPKATKLQRVSEFKFLDSYGEIGEYMKLEIKSMMRNKNQRKNFISATVLVILITVICSLSDVYDGFSMSNFWCIYNLVVYASMFLIKIMCAEGNYIDALMVHKENILSLLRAKYLFFSILILFPTLLLMPTVFTGKWPLEMILSYALFTAGFQYFCIFQLAVYNKTTIPLNTKFISRNGIENNYIQFIMGFSVFLVPMSIISFLNNLLGANATYAVMAFIGIIFIATHKLWLRNIYNRMMKRRYENMEGFHNS